MLKTLAKTLDSFLYHPATPESAQAHDFLRNTMISLARDWFDRLPEGREKSLAFTKLEEALMWANKAIALMDPVAQEGTADVARVMPEQPLTDISAAYAKQVQDVQTPLSDPDWVIGGRCYGPVEVEGDGPLRTARCFHRTCVWEKRGEAQEIASWQREHDDSMSTLTTFKGR